jgi:hypothetical protein
MFSAFISKEEKSVNETAKIVFAFVLLKHYRNFISMDHNYDKYNGTELPPAGGYSLINALSTYIDHGGDKTDAIRKFIDSHLGTPEQIEKLLDSISVKIFDPIDPISDL